MLPVNNAVNFRKVILNDNVRLIISIIPDFSEKSTSRANREAFIYYPLLVNLLSAEAQ